MDKEKIEAEFRRIKSLGFIPSNRTHNTGIGKTFEDLLGVRENNLRDSDFAGFEVKSQRQLSKSYLTLFTKSPSVPKGANAFLKDAYGTPDDTFPQIRVLHTSIFATRFNTHQSGFGFKLDPDRHSQRLYLRVKDSATDKLVPVEVYWTFDDLSKSILGKLKNLFVVTADHKTIGGVEHFHYTSACVYLNPSFDRFISAITEGHIMFDIRMGAYKTKGKSFGKPHDHGSGFRIRRDELHRIFGEFIPVE